MITWMILMTECPVSFAQQIKILHAIKLALNLHMVLVTSSKYVIRTEIKPCEKEGIKRQHETRKHMFYLTYLNI